MKIPYYVVISGRAYWRPTKKMRQLGFALVRLGEDGPLAWARAKEWNDRWQRVRQGKEQPPLAVIGGKLTIEQAESAIVWPTGSIGDGFARYRTTGEWKRKAARTREDWWRAWRHIKPIFGDIRPRDVTLESMSEFRTLVEEKVSLREAHRVIKVWRALWQVLAALRYCAADEDPSFGIVNSAAPGRSDVWAAGEVVRLIKHAWRTNRRGLAAALAIMWDSQCSPVDVRTLSAGQIVRDGAGAVFFTQRAKTGASIGGVLSRRAAAVVTAYVEGLGFDLLADAPLIRTPGAATTRKGGRPWAPQPYTKDAFTEAFRELRSELFGPAEKRQMLDFRRSGAVEAIAGETTREKLGHAMGNSIAASDQLFRTYVPVNVTTLRDVAEARQRGRRKIRDGNK